MRRAALCVALLAIALAGAGATFLSEVRGVVLDPKGNPIKATRVTLQSQTSGFSLTDKTDDDGAFLFIGLSSGEYTVSVEAAGFVKAEKLVRVVSGSSPEIRFQLEVMALKENVQVTPAPEEVGAETPTPTTLISKEQIKRRRGPRAPAASG